MRTPTLGRRAKLASVVAFVALAFVASRAALERLRDAEPEPTPFARPDHGRPTASCGEARTGCGEGGRHDCCAAPAVPGGTFARSQEPASCPTPGPVAEVAPFALDRYEVTVARFRAFVEAGGATRERPPPPGAGAHPRVAASGWQPRWSDALEPSIERMREHLVCSEVASFTQAPGPNEALPIDCATWYEAFAFCAWDGGRLPTEAEWNLAATGGAEQRVYPWSSPPASDAIDARHAVFSRGRVEAVGAHSPAGDGRWGHSDLAGNVWEWTLDRGDPRVLLPAPGADRCERRGMPQPCADCANLARGPGRVSRGGGFGMPALGMRTSIRRADPPEMRFPVLGVRCARDAAIAPRDASVEPAERDVDAGAPAPVAAPYPGGASGFDVGDTLPALHLHAFGDAARAPQGQVDLALSDLYDPDGRGALPPGSGFGAGARKPRWLLLHLGFDRAAEPQADALRPLAALVAAQPAGRVAAVALLLANDHTGQPADALALVMWARRAGWPSLAAFDPAGDVLGRAGAKARLLLVDTRTMRVVAVEPGALDEGSPIATRLASPD